MKFWAQRHRVYHDWLFIGVVVQDDDLEQTTGPIRGDHEIPPLTRDDAYGIANRMLDVFVADTVPSGAGRDLHLDKVALSI